MDSAQGERAGWTVRKVRGRHRNKPSTAASSLEPSDDLANIASGIILDCTTGPVRHQNNNPPLGSAAFRHAL